MSNISTQKWIPHQPRIWRHGHKLAVLLVFLTIAIAGGHSVAWANSDLSVTVSAVPLTDQDFTFQAGGQTLYPGQDWDSLQDWQEKMTGAEETTAPEYTLFPGDSFRDGYSGNIFIKNGDNTSYYKIYSHYYENNAFAVLTSNLYYDKPPKRDFNTYRVAQIAVYSSKYATSRKIRVGMSTEQLIKAYGKGETNKIHDNDWIKYTRDNRWILFGITDGKIDSILITYPEIFDWMISQEGEP